MVVSIASALVSFVCLGAFGCADEFDPYTEVAGLRLLGIRSSPPELVPEADATLDALVTTDATYAWSWCPLAFGGVAEDECPVTEVELAQLIAASGSSAEAPPYDLGSEATTTFTHSIPPDLLAGICQAFSEQDLPEGVPRPECNGIFEISIRLRVSTAEAQVTGTRSLGLIYQEGVVPNVNPAVLGGEISVRGAPPFVLSGDAPTTATRDVEYRLDLDVDESSPEMFETQDGDETVTELESLTMTWFYEGGEMDKDRSSFIDGVTTLENLGENLFRTPLLEEFAPNSSRLFFVLRDERGGMDWFSSTLELVE